MQGPARGLFTGRSAAVLTVFTSPTCSLCEPVKELALAAPERHDVVVQVVDITKDRDAFRKYKWEIPVVTLNGAEVARHRLDAATLDAALLPYRKHD